MVIIIKQKHYKEVVKRLGTPIKAQWVIWGSGKLQRMKKSLLVQYVSAEWELAFLRQAREGKLFTR